MRYIVETALFNDNLDFAQIEVWGLQSKGGVITRDYGKELPRQYLQMLRLTFSKYLIHIVRIFHLNTFILNFRFKVFNFNYIKFIGARNIEQSERKGTV